MVKQDNTAYQNNTTALHHIIAPNHTINLNKISPNRIIPPNPRIYGTAGKKKRLSNGTAGKKRLSNGTAGKKTIVDCRGKNDYRTVRHEKKNDCQTVRQEKKKRLSNDTIGRKKTIVERYYRKKKRLSMWETR